MTILDASKHDANRHDGQPAADADTAFDALLDRVRSEFDTTFTWDYERSRDGLNRLYEKAKRSQWNVSDDLDWSIDVDPERAIRLQAEATGIPAGMPARSLLDVKGSPVASWDDDKWVEFAVQAQSASLSQFLHGEQGALLCTAKIVETVPWIDAKYYAATQVVDEARHVEVFAQYLDQKLGGIKYPVNTHLGSLLDDIISDSRWDMTYLGMQIMVEGLALAAFGFMQQTTEEPLLKKLLRYVMADEARHVAFGVLSLQEVYQELTVAELRDRQEFAFEAALQMRDRFMRQEVWERMGVDVKDMVKFTLAMPDELRIFQKMLFSKIVPNCKKLGLLDAGDGWLRDRFTDIGVIEFENWVDTADEYADLDEVAKDRALAEG